MRRVLVVDDDPDIRTLLSESLEGEGYDVRSAENGATALRCLKARRPDVIVLDLTMPVMDGRRFREEQWRDPALAAIPVIIISTVVPDEGLHADAYLAKPFSLSRLLAELDRISPAPR